MPSRISVARSLGLGLAAALLIGSGAARATVTETAPYTAVNTVVAGSVGVPIEETFTSNAAGVYTVTLTDLGAAFKPTAAPLASLSLAVIQGSTVIGTALSAAGSTTVTLAASTAYTIVVVGTPGAPGSGPIALTVTDPTGNLLLAPTGLVVAATPTALPATEAVINQTFAVPTAGTYQVTFTDYAAPSALTAVALLLIPTGGSTPLAALAAPGSVTTSAPLEPGTNYTLFAAGAGPAGLYSVVVKPAGGGTPVLAQATPVGSVLPIGSVPAADTATDLSVRDLGFPNPLSAVGALVTQGGQLVASLTAAGDTAIAAPTTSTAGNDYLVYGYATAAAGAAGSYTVDVKAASGAAFLHIANAVADPSTSIAAYAYSTTVSSAGSYTLAFTDFGLPATLTAAQAAAFQNSTEAGSALATGATATASYTASAVDLIVSATPATGGGLFGLDLSPAAGGTAVFATSQGVGAAFSLTPVAVTTSGKYNVTVTDVGFPAKFSNLLAAVTQGTQTLGYIFGGGTFSFQATPGTYSINFIATPASVDAGTYSLSVAPAPPAPTVTLASSVPEVSSGGTVTLTWSTQNATSCVASGGWSGTLGTSGTLTSAAITAATTFTLTCTGAGGSTAESVNVTLAPASHGGGAIDGGLLAVLVLALLFSRVVSRARRGLAVALVCAALLAGCGGPHARFESHVQRGKQYFDHGEFQKARIEFLNALRIEPKNGDATLLVGRANEKLGDIRAAIGSYQAAVDMHPDDPAPRAALGRLMLMSGAADQAAAMVAPGLKAHPLDPDLLVVRAGVRMQQSDLSDARVDAEAAVKAAPQNEDALALLASLYRRVDGPQKAIDFLEGETAQLPKAEGLRLILASLYMETGADEKAEPVLVKLTELKPEDEGLRNQLAHFYVRSKRLDDAERVLDEAVKAFPKSNEAKLELVTFLAAERSHEAAERRLGGFIGKKPDDLDLRMMLGDLRYQFAEPDGAIEAYRAIIAKDPHGPQGLKAKDHIAGIEFQRGHADVGEKLVREVLASNARDSDALLMRVNLELDRNDPAAAIVDLRGLLRDQPNSMPLELLLARAQLANGETGLAEATLRGALQAAPGSLDASISLSRFLIDTGRAAEGQSVAEGALQRDPNSPAALAMVARAEIINGRWTEAQQTAEKLESLDRKSALGPYLIARAALGRRDFEVAGRALERALALDPVSVDVLAAYAKFDNARGHGGAAIARVRKTLEAHPDDARVGNLLGMLYAGSKDLPQAIEALNATIARAPDWVEPRRNLAVVKLAANDMNGAIAAYEGALKLAPTDAQTVASLADLYVREGRVEDAIARYEALYKANVRVRAFAANNLAMLLVNYHKDPESLKRARELTETFSTSDDAAYLDTSGWVRLKGGEVREALPLLERAVARAPDSRVIRYHVALAELEVGDRGKAKTNLETALAGSARFEGVEDARSVLARLKNSAG